MHKRQIAVLMTALFVFGMAGVDAKRIVISTRTTNTGAASGEADGIEPAGDRQNSYAWAMDVLSQPDGDYLYVGSNRNLIYSIVRAALHVQGVDPSLWNSYINMLFQGDIFTPPLMGADNQGRVFRYNLDHSGDWEPVHKGNYAYRGAQTYTDVNGDTALYMVTSSDPGYVLKFPDDFDPDNDEPTVVLRVVGDQFEGPLRAITVHEDKLVVGTFTGGNRIFITDLPQEQDEEGDEATEGWEQIADAGDLGAVGLWHVQSYNGYLYVFVAGGGTNGFSVYKGSPGANGWVWEQIVGDGPDAKYPRGMGDPYSNAVAVGVFNDHVYVGSMTETHISFILGQFGADRIQGAHIYRFDENDDWELVIGDPGRTTVFDSRIGNYGAGFLSSRERSRQNLLLSGTPLAGTNISFNQYIWWFEEHNGRLYTTTFDFRIFMKYVTPELLEFLGLNEDQIEQVIEAVNLLDLVIDNPPGFDVYVTSDGVDWEPVTRDGFGDQYNYGGRTLKSAGEAGLFVGTANPFYGCQVWMLEEIKKKSDSSSNGNCFIATAAYGTPMAAEIDALRGLRDGVLMSSEAGRAAIGAYYRFSPPAAGLIGRSESARAIVRQALRPLVCLSSAVAAETEER